MATVRCLRHSRNSAGKELSQTSVSRRHRTKSHHGLDRQASGTLCPTNQRILVQDEVVRPHESVATAQAIWETEPYSSKPTDQSQENPWMRKTGHRYAMSLNPKVTSPGCGSQDPRTAATIQVRRQLSGVYNTVGTVQARN